MPTTTARVPLLIVLPRAVQWSLEVIRAAPVQGVVLMAGVMIVILNFVIDILYAYVDPRIRLSR